MDTHNLQLQYWNQFVRLKRDALYIGRYHGSIEAVDMWLNIFTAIASSAAIGGWVIWRDAGYVWGGIIAA